MISHSHIITSVCKWINREVIFTWHLLLLLLLHLICPISWMGWRDGWMRCRYVMTSCDVLTWMWWQFDHISHFQNAVSSILAISSSTSSSSSSSSTSSLSSHHHHHQSSTSSSSLIRKLGKDLRIIFTKCRRFLGLLGANSRDVVQFLSLQAKTPILGGLFQVSP